MFEGVLLIRILHKAKKSKYSLFYRAWKFSKSPIFLLIVGYGKIRSIHNKHKNS